MRTRAAAACSVSLLLTGAFLFTSTFAAKVVVATGLNLPMVFLAGALLFTMLETLYVGRLRSAASLSEKLAFGTAVWAVCSNAWTVAPSETASVSYYYVWCVAAYVVVRRAAKGKSAAAFLGTAFVGGGVVSAMLTLTAWNANAAAGEQFRSTVGDVNANYVAYSLATAVGFCFALSWNAEISKLGKTLLLAAAGFCGAVLLLTGTRGALLSCVSMAGVFAVGSMRTRSASGMLLVLGLAIVGWVAFRELPDSLQIRLTTLTDSSYDPAGKNDLSGRLQVWPIALRCFLDSPGVGIGAGAFPAVNPLGIAVHNVPLSIAAELGVVGVLLYGGVVWASFGAARQAACGPRLRLTALALLSGWLPIALSGAWDASLVAWAGFAFASRLQALGHLATIGPVDSPMHGVLQAP